MTRFQQAQFLGRTLFMPLTLFKARPFSGLPTGRFRQGSPLERGTADGVGDGNSSEERCVSTRDPVPTMFEKENKT